MASYYPLLPRRSNRLSTLRNKNLPSPLIHLYDEIWTLILKKLTQNEALNLRTVNKNFKTKVDKLYGDWVIVLDENYPYLDMILDLRLKKVTVEGLFMPMPNRPPGIILKFPDLLESIDVQYSSISAENLHILLQSKNLKRISIDSYLSSDVFWKTLDPLFGYNFPELRSLIIDLDYCNRLVEENFYECFLTRSKMPNLRSLKVDWGAQNAAEFQRLASTLYSFMGRLGQTLKHFSYAYVADTTFSELSILDESALQNCQALETFKIYSLQLGNTDYFMDTWRRLIENQSKLTVLEIDADFRISRTMWARVCSNNYRTLTKFDFRGVRVESESALYDLSIFSKCVNLKYFSLNLSSRTTGEFFCNFETLPAQIETLVVRHFCICSEEFSKFLKSHHSLVNLEIDSVADEGEFGVNSSVLKDILNHDSLKSVRIGYGCIPITDTESELTELTTIFSGLGCTTAWNEFEEVKLDKSSDSNTWAVKDR